MSREACHEHDVRRQGRPHPNSDADRTKGRTTTTDAVGDPYRNTVVANAPRSTLIDLDDALDAAVNTNAKAAAAPALERAALLRRAGKSLV
jgi:acyl-CoA reductase-like NAD-dependent aldehyde dehydrogenase